MIMIRFDTSTLVVTMTPDPDIFTMSVEFTEDGDEIPDYEKTFTKITIRGNVNMKKADLVKVVTAEIQRIRAAPSPATILTNILNIMGDMAVDFDRTPPAPPEEPEGGGL